MLECPSLRSSKKRWELEGSWACSGFRRGEATIVKVPRLVSLKIGSFINRLLGTKVRQDAFVSVDSLEMPSLSSPQRPHQHLHPLCFSFGVKFPTSFVVHRGDFSILDLFHILGLLAYHSCRFSPGESWGACKCSVASLQGTF